MALLLLFYRHLVWLILVPTLMAGAAWGVLQSRPAGYASSTTLYTGVVSGYTIESGQGQRSEYHVVNNRFDNLLHTLRARPTIEDVSIQLIAEQLTGRLHIHELDAGELLAPLGDAEWMPEVSEDTPDALAERLRLALEDPTGPLYDLVHRQKTPFSIETIQSNLESKRVGVSDLVDLRYTAPDPILAQRTLALISQSFQAKYRTMKRQEAGTVVAYFERETDRAQKELQERVEAMRRFGTENRVINYYEQTKAVAGQKELIDHEIQQERMALAASRTSLEEIERKLGDTERLMSQHARVMQAQQGLARATASAALSGHAADSLARLRAGVEQEVQALYQLSRSKEGMAKEDLVAQWLAETLAVGERTARLDVLERRRETYQREYDVFAPLGSELSTLEREVDIAERAYLELLHSLNLAKMREQNVELSSGLQVISPPSRPDEPLPSRLMLLVLLAFAGGLGMAGTAVFAVDHFDPRLRTPEIASGRTGLPLAGALPANPAATPVLATALSSGLAERVRIAAGQAPGERPARIALVPVRAGAEDDRVAHVLRACVPDAQVARLAPLLDAPGSLAPLAIADAIVLVVHAAHVWSPADAYALETLRAATPIEPVLAVTGVAPHALTSISGGSRNV